MMAKTTDHFTAVIIIEEVYSDEVRGQGGRLEPVKDKREVSKIVVRAKTLQALTNKVNAHVALVDEE